MRQCLKRKLKKIRPLYLLANICVLVYLHQLLNSKFISISALTEHVVQNTEYHGSTRSTIGMTSSKAKVSSGLSVAILGKYFGIQNYYSMFCPLFDSFIVTTFEF